MDDPQTSYGHCPICNDNVIYERHGDVWLGVCGHSIKQLRPLRVDGCEVYTQPNAENLAQAARDEIERLGFRVEEVLP